MLLAMIWLMNAVAVFGYAVFVRNPEYLSLHPIFPVIFGQSYQFFSRVSIILAFLALTQELLRDWRFKWVPALIAVFVLSAGAELLGTSTGLPFGPYEYTALLGPKIAELVPWLIPVSWFTMAVPAYIMAREYQPGKTSGNRLRRITVASLILVQWDLTLDPAMSQLTPFWTWGTTGPYYGTPLSNLLGWFVVSFLIMAALEGVIGKLRLGRPRWFTQYYLANLLLPFGICLAAGLWLAVGISTAALAILWLTRKPPSQHLQRKKFGVSDKLREGFAPPLA